MATCSLPSLTWLPSGDDITCKQPSSVPNISHPPETYITITSRMIAADVTVTSVTSVTPKPPTSKSIINHDFYVTFHDNLYRL